MFIFTLWAKCNLKTRCLKQVSDGVSDDYMGENTWYVVVQTLKGKQSQCLDHMGLTELIKSNNFQQQSYF